MNEQTMRHLAGALIFVALWPLPDLCEIACASPSLHGSVNAVTVYDANPAHLWNRLHSVIFVRTDIPSTAQVPDAIDPPLWLHTQYLLTGPSHERFLQTLDEFLQTHGERLIQDPVKRAILQRDLWSVFDWSVEREPDHLDEPAFNKEKQELQIRLAEVMRRLALTPEQIHALPSNYAQAVASGQFADNYDPDHPNRAFLPPDLLDPHGQWVQILGNGIPPEPLASSHARTFSRSSFLVFLSLPGGRKPTFDYLQTLWDFPQPWIPRPDDERHEQTSENPRLPPFPVGTKVALVRQMMLFDNQGNLEPTPITESIQMRVYRKIAPIDENSSEPMAFARSVVMKSSEQDVYQIVLSRPRLFASGAGGLRATERDEREFQILNAFGADMSTPPMTLDKALPVLHSCVICHRGAGISSLNIRGRLLKPNWLQHEYVGGEYDPKQAWWEYENDVNWKQGRYDWGLLSGYWKAAQTH